MIFILIYLNVTLSNVIFVSVICVIPVTYKWSCGDLHDNRNNTYSLDSKTYCGYSVSTLHRFRLDLVRQRF